MKFYLFQRKIVSKYKKNFNLYIMKPLIKTYFRSNAEKLRFNDRVNLYYISPNLEKNIQKKKKSIKFTVKILKTNNPQKKMYLVF